MENIFKRNLSVITGNGSLVKLDVVDSAIETRRFGLIKEHGFDANDFDAALFIYCCNVIDESNEFPFAVNRKDLIATSAKSVVMYFNDIMLKGEPKCELWCYACNLKNTAALGKLYNDMDRLYKVWHELTLEK